MSKSKKTVDVELIPRDQYIELLAMRTREVSINNGNSKTGFACWTMSLPVCTCREDAPCRQSGECYCTQGTQQMARVQQAYVRNYKLFSEDRKDTWEQVRFKIKHAPLPYFRYNDSGDILDYEYITEMAHLANEFPNVKFLAYTKWYELVNQWINDNGELPENLTIRFSPWDKDWYGGKIPNPHNLPMAWVDFADKSKNPEFPEKMQKCPNQSDSSITCSCCGKCWNKKIHDVVFVQHGKIK